MLVVFSLGVVYALPNIYPPDFAVQISTESADGTFTEHALNTAAARLKEESVEYFGAEMQENGGLIRFRNDEAQLRARDLIQLALHDLPDEYVVALNSAATTPQWLVDIGGEPMKYGLDLRGGVHFLMEVDTESAIGERIEGLEQDIKRTFREKDDRIRYTGFTSPVTGALRIVFSDEETRDRGESKLKDRYPQYLIVASQASPELTLTVDDASIREMEDFAVQQNLQAIRNRVNELGVSEPLVQRLGRDRIVVDLPELRIYGVKLPRWNSGWKPCRTPLALPLRSLITKAIRPILRRISSCGATECLTQTLGSTRILACLRSIFGLTGMAES